jgi:hypothetical protein
LCFYAQIFPEATLLSQTGMAVDAMSSQSQGLAAPPPGEIVPKEGPNPDGPGKKPSPTDLYGPNYEYLEQGRPAGQNGEPATPGKPKVVQALRQLELQYRTEAIVARRHEIREYKRARFFWQGNQYLLGWESDRMDFRMPEGSTFGLSMNEEQNLESGGRYQFVTNFYQALGLSFIAVVSSDVPTVNWFPQSAQNEIDITAAKAASDAEKLIEENNKVEELLTWIGFYLWTDGKVGGYVRYVADGQQFGFKDSPVMAAQPQKLGDDTFSCTNCGSDTPPGQMFAGMICPNCGTQLGQDNFKEAPTVNVPVVTSTKRVPNGQEVISIIGGLELNTPVWASYQHQMPYLQWQLEVHKAKLKAAYPLVADKILPGNPTGADDVYNRSARLAVEQGLPTTHPGDALVSLVTFTRNWIRPWAFFEIEDKDIREDLLALFPDGAYCAFAGDTYCESRSEGMDDHWRICHALPGDGQNRPGVGHSFISPQERYNILSNMQMECAEFGIPPIYADPQVLDFDSLSNQTAEPSQHYPARAKPGQPLEAGFFQPAPAQMPPDAIKYMQDLAGPTGQFLTGIFPAIFGGQTEGGAADTASGYQMQRDQAMGRLGMIWRRIKVFYAELMMLAVDCFRKNRPEDVEIPTLGEDGEYEAKIISITDLKGNIQARPEADETYPRMKSQQRAVIQQLFALAPNAPEIAEILSEPSNLREIKTTMGLNDLVIPGEDSANKQLREISQLMQAQPIVQQGTDPVTGAPTQQMHSTVPVNVLLDRHEVEFKEIERWANSKAGLAAKAQNPAGFANVQAHAQEHLQGAAQRQQMMMAFAPPPPPQAAPPPQKKAA